MLVGRPLSTLSQSREVKARSSFRLTIARSPSTETLKSEISAAARASEAERRRKKRQRSATVALIGCPSLALRAMLSAMTGKPNPVRPLASNKRVRHDYEVLDTFEAGLELTGTEVKAARNGKIQLKDSYVDFRDGQAFLVGAHISQYSHGNRENHQPERPRRVLLNKR